MRGRVTRRHQWKEWIEAALPIALGPLELTHAAFYRLTPREFHELLDGWTWRRRRRDEEVAHWIAVLIQPHVKDRVSASKLLGRPLGDLPEGRSQ